jgi:hypothetical protein
MNLVSELGLPAFDYTAPDFSADRYHQQLAETRQRGCLALAFLAPRTRGLALDGPRQLGGVEGIYGIDKLPVIWSGPSTMSPTTASPDVS